MWNLGDRDGKIIAKYWELHECWIFSNEFTIEYYSDENYSSRNEIAYNKGK